MSPNTVHRRDIPWRDTHRITYFVRRNRGLETLTYAEAVLVAADPKDRRKVFMAYTDTTGAVHVQNAGQRFTALAKRAVRSAQERDHLPRCDASTKAGTRCKSPATTTWRDLDVCALHDPEGKFAAENPEFAKETLIRLRSIKRAEVERLEDRLTALLLERFGPSKGKGLIG